MMEYVFVDDLHRYKRLKVTRACESCRRRKVKCDGGSGGTQTPCSSCRKLKIECIFSNMALKRAAPKTEQEQMEERMQRLETILSKLDEDDSARGKKDVLGTMKIENNGKAGYINCKLVKDGDGKTDAQHMLFLPEPPLPMAQYSGVHTGADPSPELAAELIQLYFKHVHPYVPVLHKANFINRLNDKTANPISPLLLYAVFAMAAKFSDNPNVRLDPVRPETAGLGYYNRARDLLDDFLDTPRLSTVQAQILMLKYQEGIRRNGFFFRSWMYFGMITRMAQDLGLNKNFDKWNLHTSREDAIAGKRVWQLCFLCDQFMSGAQGRDVMISLSNTDAELPHKDEYEGDDEEFQIQTDFIHLVRLTKILASVMSVIAPAGSGTQLSAWHANPKLMTLDQALEAWIGALPPRLQCTNAVDAANGSPMRPPNTHFAGFLNILYFTIVILLHRPYITSIENKVMLPNPHHLSMCTTAANNISQIAQSMFDTWGPMVFQYPLRGGNFGVYCLVAASMIHLVNMSAEPQYARPAHDHLLRTLRVLQVCVEHSAAWELRDKVQALEAAFSAQRMRQPMMLFHPGAHDAALAQSVLNRAGFAKRRPMPRRRNTEPNGGQVNPSPPLQSSYHQPMLSHSLSDSLAHSGATNPQFQDRPLFILSEEPTSGPPVFTQEPEQHPTFDFPSMEDPSALLSSQLGSLPLTPPLTVPSAPADGYNPMNGGLDPNNPFWDQSSLMLLNQLSASPSSVNGQPGTVPSQQRPHPHQWSGSGTISPISISTSPTTTPSPVQASSPSAQSIDLVTNGNASTVSSGTITANSSPVHVQQLASHLDHHPSVVVASQNEDVMMRNDVWLSN